MKTLTKILLATLLGASLLQAAAFEKVANVPETKVTLSSEKPLSTGSNTLKVTIADEKFKDAQVRIKVFMPTMSGMSEMVSESEAKSLGNGSFSVEVNLSMSGTWQVHIFITPSDGKKIRAKTSLNI
ncbi:MAG: FixH family protein [Sulfurimonas sp.]|nr:FixH family protein [Sulfurimonas sp.]